MTRRISGEKGDEELARPKNGRKKSRQGQKTRKLHNADEQDAG